jgi:hypothetical protein
MPPSGRDRASTATAQQWATSRARASGWNQPTSAVAAAYPANRGHVGRSRARSSSSVASTTAAITTAYIRCSCAYREMAGVNANSTPAITPTRADVSRAPSCATSPPAVAIARTEGSRSATSDVPKSAAQARIRR